MLVLRNVFCFYELTAEILFRSKRSTFKFPFLAILFGILSSRFPDRFNSSKRTSLSRFSSFVMRLSAKFSSLKFPNLSKFSILDMRWLEKTSSCRLTKECKFSRNCMERKKNMNKNIIYINKIKRVKAKINKN